MKTSHGDEWRASDGDVAASFATSYEEGAEPFVILRTDFLRHRSGAARGKSAAKRAPRFPAVLRGYGLNKIAWHAGACSLNSCFVCISVIIKITTSGICLVFVVVHQFVCFKLFVHFSPALRGGGIPRAAPCLCRAHAPTRRWGERPGSRRRRDESGAH